MKKLIAAVTTAGLLVVGTAGIAQAAESPTPQTEARMGHGAGRRAIAALKVAATTIGVEPKALWTAVRDGQSVADVARSHNVDPQKVVDAIVAAANTKIDQAASAGKIDADRAATLKAKAPDRIAKLVNGELKGRARHRVERAKLRRHARRAGVAIAAKVIGVEPSALVAAVRGGQSVADVARDHNVDPQKVVDAVVAAANKKVDAAVDAGKINADRAGTIKERLADRIAKRVNATPGERGAATS